MMRFHFNFRNPPLDCQAFRRFILDLHPTLDLVLRFATQMR
jgi:hypothetical protein